jgi:hypothetical protein
MTDFEFYNECIELGAKKIYELIKSLSDWSMILLEEHE